MPEGSSANTNTTTLLIFFYVSKPQKSILGALAVQIYQKMLENYVFSLSLSEKANGPL